MSNLYKGTRIINTSSSARVIDYNEKVMERLEAIKEQMMNANVDTEGFVSGLQAPVVEVLVEDENEQDEALDMTEEVAREKVSELIHSAKTEADNIINTAQIKAAEIREQAKKEGYEEGWNEANKKLEESQKKNEKLLLDEKKKLQDEYEALKKRIEPELVETLLTVFTRVTHTMADSNKDTILHLIESVMRNTEISKEFLIRVSKEDYQFMLNSKEILYEHVSKNVRIELYQDTTLKRNQCIIETDAGVFDCSLDIQLENLVKEIRILSCLVD